MGDNLLRFCTKYIFYIIVLIVFLGGGPSGVYAQTENLDPDSITTHDWLEPKGLNIVDMVGQVPEEYLSNAIVSFSGEGMVQYISGQRQGNQVTIDARIYTKALGNDSYFNCLGQWAFRDQWPSVTPAATMRLYEGDVEVTDQVTFVQYYAAGQNPPDNGATATRYNRTPAERVTFTPSGAIDLRANMGCILSIPGDHPEMTAKFEIEYKRQVSIEQLGQETFRFHSYIGPGDAGRVNSLRGQMASRFGNRHDKFTLDPPAGAEYLLVSYPPTPVSPYPTGPVDGPSSGTYRLAHGYNVLSVDHTVSMGLPLHGQWRDADQSGGVEYLPQIDNVDTLTAPEYFVPTGVAYDSCMSDGGCPTELLDRIYAGEMPLTIYYFRVNRMVDGLDRVPLRQVGTGGRSSLAEPGQALSRALPPAWAEANHRIFIAAIANGPDTPPDDSEGCPCGWFDADGIMLDFIAGP